MLATRILSSHTTTRLVFSLTTAWRTARPYSRAHRPLQAQAQSQPQPEPQSQNASIPQGEVHLPHPPAPVDHRASAKLFQDAADEEAALAERESRARRLEARLTKDENWTGDEPMEHAVLRMLVDKYKPLRSGSVRTAEEKLKRAPPPVGAQSLGEPMGEGVNPPGDDAAMRAELEVEADVEVRTTWGASVRGRSMRDVPLLPSIEGHQPWHTTFRVPSHAQSSVKYGKIPPSARTPTLSALDDKARRKEREARKRTEHGLRLHNARESTLDYRLGVKGGRAGEVAQFRRHNPIHMKGWTGLVEERIERARQEGRFDTVKGRGKPLTRVAEEHNPFIAREEFLMNRIVQRQGAAPPWIEIQQELESAVSAFREVVRQSWTRRAIRMLTLSRPAALLPRLTLDDAAALRDAEWETRERAYHDTALDEINGLVRKYNGLAPYAVRRPYYMLSAELERAYKESGEEILRGIAARSRAAEVRNRGAGDEEEDVVSRSGNGDGLPVLRIGDMVRQWFARLVGR